MLRNSCTRVHSGPCRLRKTAISWLVLGKTLVCSSTLLELFRSTVDTGVPNQQAKSRGPCSICRERNINLRFATLRNGYRGAGVVRLFEFWMGWEIAGVEIDVNLQYAKIRKTNSKSRV